MGRKQEKEIWAFKKNSLIDHVDTEFQIHCFFKKLAEMDNLCGIKLNSFSVADNVMLSPHLKDAAINDLLLSELVVKRISCFQHWW